MATSAALLRAMNLTEQDTTNDLVLKDRKNFPARTQFQTDILNSDLWDDKPEGPDLWAVNLPTAQVQAPPPPSVTCTSPSLWSPPAYLEVMKMALRKKFQGNVSSPERRQPNGVWKISPILPQISHSKE